MMPQKLSKIQSSCDSEGCRCDQSDRVRALLLRGHSLTVFEYSSYSLYEPCHHTGSHTWASNPDVHLIVSDVFDCSAKGPAAMSLHVEYMTTRSVSTRTRRLHAEFMLLFNTCCHHELLLLLAWLTGAMSLCPSACMLHSSVQVQS